MFEGFESADISTGETHIFVRHGGAGPRVLLLHGFPETHLMWRDLAPILARDFSVVCADLRGYGRSGCPPSTFDHAPYAKRAMARDMVAVMLALGFERFSVAGHDRGGRVAYRLALDHPERVERLAVLDVVPTETVWARADARLALSFWPWSLLAQPAPLPEQLLGGAPRAVIDDARDQWGSAEPAFPGHIAAAYVEALRDPAHLHAICEEYRAAAGLDRAHDQADLVAGRRIACPLLALWSAPGTLDDWYAEANGPLELWRIWANDVRGRAIRAGHFFPEEIPDEISLALGEFFAGRETSSAGHERA